MTKSKFKPRQTTKAQSWAQQRNWFKARLLSVKSTVGAHADILTEEERYALSLVFADITALLNVWEDRNIKSKQAYIQRKGNKNVISD